MSYARFSSDNWKSDVYVYESVDDVYVIHTAKRRRKYPLPKEWLFGFPPRWFAGKWDRETREFVYKSIVHKWLFYITSTPAMWWYRFHQFLVRHVPLETIEHEDAGKTFITNTPQECISMLQSLQAKGFYVPQKCFDRLQEEANGLSRET